MTARTTEPAGGGVSGFFALPSWQASLSAVDNQGGSTALTKRGVPDVAGNADPETGYMVRIDGVDSVIGGTSAVAPLWAALLARINQTTGKPAGFLNPLLYQNPQALRDIIRRQQRRFQCGRGLGRLHRTRQSERRRARQRALARCCGRVSVHMERTAGAEQTEQSDEYQINRDDVVEQLAA